MKSTRVYIFFCLYMLSCSNIFTKIPSLNDDKNAIKNIIAYIQNPLNKRQFFFDPSPIYMFNIIKVDTSFFDYGYKSVNFIYECVYIDTALAPLIRESFLKDKSSFVDFEKLSHVKNKKIILSPDFKIDGAKIVIETTDFKSLNDYVYYFSPLIPLYKKDEFTMWVRLQKSNYDEPTVFGFHLNKLNNDFKVLSCHYFDYDPLELHNHIENLSKSRKK